MSARVNANDNSNLRPVLMFLAMFAALAAVGLIQSWSLALAILNLCLISAVMSPGSTVSAVVAVDISMVTLSVTATLRM